MKSKIEAFRNLYKSGSFQVKDEDIELFLEAVKECVNKDDDIQGLMQDMKDEGEVFRINLELTSPPFWTACIQIEDGKFETGWRKLDNPTLRIMADKEVLMGVVTNKASMLKAYSDGKIKIEGQLMKAAPLGMIISKVGEQLGLF